MITIDTRKLYHILDVTPASHNIMLVGSHGIGKSEILTEYFTTRGLRVVPLFLGQMSDPGDLIGLPVLSTLSTPSTPSTSSSPSTPSPLTSTHFAPPFWFPTDGKPIVLFLDELNRARPEILQTVMDLALNRRLAGHVLPTGSRIISAVNDGEEYQLTMLDPALVSRFNVYQFCPTAQEWLLWAGRKQLDQRVIAFIQSQPTLLDGTPEQQQGIDTGLEKLPDRRAWQRVSDVIIGRKDLGDDDLELIAGIVGAAAASRFYAFTQGRQMLNGADILNDFASHEATLRLYRLHQISIISEDVFRQLEVSYEFNATSDSLQQSLIERYATNFKAYFSFLEATEQRESIAFIANLFENGSYPNAILFITNHCPEIYTKMIDFISNL